MAFDLALVHRGKSTRHLHLKNRFPGAAAEENHIAAVIGCYAMRKS
jgi:hypothetical protein